MFGLPRLVATEPQSAGARALVFTAAVVFPTAIRAALGPVLGSTLVYTAYFPAALVVTLMLGRYPGALYVLLCAVLADFLFVPPLLTLRHGVQQWAGMLVFMLAAAIVVITADALRTAVHKLQAGHLREATLTAELRDRVKNTLSVVQALANQTVVGEAHRQVYEQFLSRLQVLSQAHDLLSLRNWEMCELPQLARAALAPFLRPTLTLKGPPCTMPPETCVPLMLMLHELGANAITHGALSSPGGRVSLTWSTRQHDGVESVLLQWQESGGPAVTPPTRRGLGSRVLTPQAGLGKVDLHFDRRGVTCHIEAKALPRNRERIVAAVWPGYSLSPL